MFMLPWGCLHMCQAVRELDPSMAGRTACYLGRQCQGVASCQLLPFATRRAQLKSLGFSYDWDREVSTCEPKYYK
jgi:hypothetical protein